MAAEESDAGRGARGQRRADRDPWERTHWELKGRVDSAVFLRALDAAFPEATTLFVEARPSPDVDSFLRSAAEPGPYLPDRNTTWPKENLYRLPFDAKALASLADLAERHAAPELLSHMHLYVRDSPLLYWPDAFDRGSPVLVADAVDPDRLRTFASELGFALKQVAETNGQGRDESKRGCLILGISLLVAGAAAICALYLALAR